MATVTDSVVIASPVEKSYQQCCRSQFLIGMVPGLNAIDRLEPNQYRLRLSLLAAPKQVTTNITQPTEETPFSGNTEESAEDTEDQREVERPRTQRRTHHRARFSGTDPDHNGVVDFSAPETGMTRIDVRIDIDSAPKAREAEVRRTLREGLDNIRVFLETKQDTNTRVRGHHDPLLHTAPRIPPEAPKRRNQ